MRGFLRHPIDIPIELEVVGKGSATQQLNNISQGGLSCEVGEYLELGTLVRIRINCVNPAFEMNGLVAWCLEKDKGYDIGIEFDAKDQELFTLRMVEQICQIEHYKNKVLDKDGRELTSEEAAREWVTKHAAEYPRVDI